MFQEFENKIKQWCEEAGEGVSYNFLQVVQYYWCIKAPGFLGAAPPKKTKQVMVRLGKEVDCLQHVLWG